MPAGYSGTPLVKKLGIKPDFKMLVINQPDHYLQILEGLPDGVEFDESGAQVDFIHFFTKDANELREKLPELKARLQKNGMLWMSWPKKASKVPTDVDETLVRKEGLNIGLVDIKICAVDEVWSGLKFVYRTKDR